MAFVVNDYATAEEHRKRLKRSGAWRKANGYETFDHAQCLHCAFFKISASLPIHGECSLMDREGVYEGVCNRFVSHQGTDIRGKRLDPGLLSGFFEIQIMKDRSVCIPRAAAG